MLRRGIGVFVALLMQSQAALCGYLNENPDDVFAGVYEKLGVKLPAAAARDAVVWMYLSELKRESCDQTSVNNLALALEKNGYRRQAAESLYNFVRSCGVPNSALRKSADILLKLTDYAKAVEVADEWIKREPQNSTAYYMRGHANQGAGNHDRALTDYADTIEWFGQDKRKLSSSVFLRMAKSYAELGRFCEAANPIMTWVAYDPARRDTSQTQRLIGDYQEKGNCRATGDAKERFPLRGRGHVVVVKAEVNGVKGNFVVDTGATYVSVKSGFADKAKIPLGTSREITLATANGHAKGHLTQADKVHVGKLQATKVPIVVQKTDEKSYGNGIDGLLGMSFLSRFEVQMTDTFIEIRSRKLRKPSS